MDPDKRATLKAEAARLARAARQTDVLLDLAARRSPGPVNDVDLDELVADLNLEQVDGRVYSIADRAGRRLQMTRRGR